MVNREFMELRETELMLNRMGIATEGMPVDLLRKIHAKRGFLEDFDQRMLIVESLLNRLQDRGGYTTEEMVVILISYVTDLIARTKGKELMEVLTALPVYFAQNVKDMMGIKENFLEQLNDV